MENLAFNSAGKHPLEEQPLCFSQETLISRELICCPMKQIYADYSAAISSKSFC